MFALSNKIEKKNKQILCFANITKLSVLFINSLLSAIRWHFSQSDGFLSLTSVKKGSDDHSQCLPLDMDANRALTAPALPPSDVP